MNFIRHFDTQGVLSCHQQYLQGPCQDGQELIQPQLEEGETEIKNSVCIPTDCGPNQIHIMNNKCVDVIQCAEDEDIYLDLTKDDEKTTCMSTFDQEFGNSLSIVWKVRFTLTLFWQNQIIVFTKQVTK